MPWFSLDALWRAAGSPANKAPRDWTVLAMPLINGVAGYHVALDRRKGEPAERGAQGSTDEVLSPATQDSEDSWRQGDLIATHTIAQAYAAFVDYDDFE